jgi:hypothetical protein
LLFTTTSWPISAAVGNQLNAGAHASGAADTATVAPYSRSSSQGQTQSAVLQTRVKNIIHTLGIAWKRC